MSDVAELSVIVKGKEVGLKSLLTAIERGLKQTDQAAEKTSKTLDRQAQAMKRDADEAIRTAQAIARLDAANGRAGQGMAVLTSALDKYGNASQRVRLGAETQLANLRKLETGAVQTGSALSGLANIAGQFGIALAVPALAQGAVELARTGAEADLVRQRFDGLAATAGTTGQALLTALRGASGGEISDLNLQLAANRAQLLGVADSAEEFATLMAIARDRAQQMGISTSQAFNDLVTGLGRGSALILDNLGITVSVTEANKAYAESLGKSVSQLTEAEQKTALINAVLTQGKATLDATGGAVESNAAAFQRLGAQGENAANQIGLAISNVIVPGVKLLGDALAGVSEGFAGLNAIGTNITALSGQIIAGSGSFDVYREQVAQANAELGVFGAALPPLTEAQFNLARSLIAQKVGASEAVERVRALGQELGTIQSAQDQMAASGDRSAAAAANLAGRLSALVAAGGPAGATAAALADGYVLNTIEADALEAALIRLEQAHLAESNAAGLAAQRSGERSAGSAAVTASVDEETQAIARQIVATQDATDRALALEAANKQIAGIAGQVVGGSLSMASAIAQLGEMYGFAADEARRLLAAQGAKIVQQNFRDQRDARERLLSGAGPQEASASALAFVAQAEKNAKAAQEARAKGARAGGAARISEEQKIETKLEDLERDHQATLADIAADGVRARLDAENALRLSQLRGRAGFYASLASIDDNALRQDLSARYEAAAQEAARIAQEQGADAAQAYLEASQKAIEGEAQLRQDIAAAEKEGDTNKAEYLKGLLSLQQAADAEELRQIREQGSAVANELTARYTAEEQAYAEHLARMAETAAQHGVTLGATLPSPPATGTPAARPTAPAGSSSTTTATPETGGKAATVVTDPATQGAVEVSGGRLESAINAVRDAVAAVERRVGDVEGAVRGLKTSGIKG